MFPSMNGQVDEDETDENKDGCSKGCDPIAPNDKEAVTRRVEASFQTVNNVENPPKVDTNEEYAKDDMRHSKSEGNRTYCEYSVAPSASTVTPSLCFSLCSMDRYGRAKKRTIRIKNLYKDELELN